MRLNLGSGDQKKEGYVNVDVCGQPDVTCDLSVFPWPWASDSVDEVFSSHFLEHVADYERTILEIHRILKPGGRLAFRVPHYRSPLAVWHLHRWTFSTFTPRFLCLSIPYQWGGRQLFEQERLAVAVYMPGAWLNRLVSGLVSRNPIFWDVLGVPIKEIEFWGKKRP